MSNETSHYFGAYLEIKVSKTLGVQPLSLICPNGHGLQNTYCRECGEKSQQQPTRMEYPTWIVDHLLDEEWEDILSVITPYELSGTGTILAKANFGGPGGEWLHITSGQNHFPSTKPFPTVDEVNAMAKELATNYSAVIEALKRSESVISMTVKTGYVMF